MYRFFLLLILALPVEMTSVVRASAPCSNQSSQTLYAGTPDDFSGGTEPTYQGSALLALFNGPWAPFDYPSPNRRFGHTFENLPCNIISATLVMQLKSTSSLASNDTFAIGATGGTPAFAWSRKVADVVSGPWNSSGLTTMLTLDLTALPLAGGGTTNILSTINGSNSLDITFQDDTTVDYFELRITSCVNSDCNNNGVEDSCEDLALVITCPQNVTAYITEETPNACCAEVTLSPSAVNPCGSAEGVVITNDYQQGPATKAAAGGLTACFPTGSTTVNFTATDAFGNTATCAVVVTVVDQVAPRILFCPEL